MAHDILAGLEKIMREIKPEAKVEKGKNLRDDLGLDSLDVISLLFEVERYFDIQIPEEDIAEKDLLEIDQFIAYIGSKLE